MPEKNSEVKQANAICTVLLHRIQAVARTRTKNLPQFPGFRGGPDIRVRPQTAIRTYARVRNLKNHKTGTNIYLQYQPAPPWLEPVKLTAISTHPKGLQRAELEEIFAQLKCPRLLTVELALDFKQSSGVNRSFVDRYGIFGRSELVGGRLYRDLRFGTRHSETMVRCYEKPTLSSYRVEFELHSKWLRRFRITQPSDLHKLPRLLYLKRIRFAALDWTELEDYLERNDRSASAINGVRSRSRSVRDALSLLRDELDLANVYRFLSPFPINEVIRHRLLAWGSWWRNSASGGRLGGSHE